MLSLSEMVERIRWLCKQNGTSLTKIEEHFGWANGAIGKWSKGKRYPPADRIRMIANYFDVPVSYITGEENEKKPTILQDSELSEDALEAIKLIQTMDPERLAKKMAALRAVLDME